MLLLALWIALLAGGLGTTAFFLVRKFSAIRLPRTTLYIGLGLTLGVALLTGWLGWGMAKADKLSFNEYWNGSELSSDWIKTTCTRDGSCVHEYNCDPYQVYVPPTYDSDGHQTGGGYWETHYHSCPYTNEEWTFTIDTTLGSYTIASSWLPTSPDAHRYRTGVGVPNYPSGIPAFWLAAKRRIDSGKPGPVAKRMSYDNYILASDRSILHSYSDEIAVYLKAGLLPKVTHAVHDFYYADKVYFVGFKPADPTAWETSLMYLNAALGTELQGDLHLVVVQNTQVNAAPDSYLLALKAYWTDPKVFGKNTLSKNGIIVVVGTTDGQTVSWARAITGMPLGNELMLQVVQSKLKGVLLTPSALVGNVRGQFYTKVKDGKKKLKVRGLHDGGALERVLWGLDDPSTKFVRISMTANDKSDVGSGFKYLDDEIQPSSDQKFWIVFTGVGISFFFWGICFFLGCGLSYENSNPSRPFGTYRGSRR